MDVILLEDLIGRAAARAPRSTSSPGYARNYLLPRRLAIAGRHQGRRTSIQELERAEPSRREAHGRGRRAPRRRKLDGVEVNIPAQANEEDTLFGSITNARRRRCAGARPATVVDKRRSSSTDHIKQLGKYDVPVPLLRRRHGDREGLGGARP